MIYRITKTASLAFVSVSLALTVVSFIRNAFCIQNPIGASINFGAAIFLCAGLIFIIRDRRKTN